MHSNEEPAWCPDTDELLEMLAHARVWAMAMAERYRLPRATLEFSVAAFSRGAVAGVFLKGTDELLNGDERMGLQFGRDDDRKTGSSAYVGSSTPGRHCFDTMTRVL